MTQPRLTAAIAASFAVLALIAAGCGGSSSSSSTTAASTSSTQPSGGGQTVKVSADPAEPEVHPASLSAKSGSVTLDMSNPSSSGLGHGRDRGQRCHSDGNIVQPGGTANVNADLKPGKYEFYCPFDSHKQQGMTAP